ncbi:unnamed protein product [Nezara viridula]|uniref:palmitoyl-protein hydrolase n=1 Tax=Nezara viridula TaxID=85310 RepID=A0A9P0MMJ2_NEZVI|nr:unnamed protein product [Nezara viridula]
MLQTCTSMLTILMCVITCSLGLYCCNPNEQVTEIVEPAQKATSAVIFLHGAGGSGPQIREVVESNIGNFSQFPTTRLIFPTAKAVPLPGFPWNGQILNIWFSFTTLVENYSFNSDEMENSAKQIERLIEEQVAAGIPHRNICLAGYSSGGMMSIYFGYGYVKKLGCIGAISSYISSSSNVYNEISIQENNTCPRLPPLYLYGGALDFLTFPNWITGMANRLKDMGIQVTYLFQWTGTHYINKDGLVNLFQFIKESII